MIFAQGIKMTQNKFTPSDKQPEEQSINSLPEDQFNKKPSVSVGQIWNKLLHLGLGETALRVGTAIASILLVILVVWVMGRFFLNNQKSSPLPTITVQATKVTPVLPVAESPLQILSSSFGINRLTLFHTNQPAKARTEIEEYEVVKGDTLFGIAEKFGLIPESLFWSNKHLLGGNADNLTIGLKILIPPIDGVIHQWDPIDGLNGVANGFKVTPDVILDWPGNRLDRNTIGEYAQPNIQPGTFVFVPGGKGTYTDWLPVFSRLNPAVASTMGPGFCGKIMDGPIGTGSFICPTTETYLSGYDYTSIHHGIDIAGRIGNAIYGVDDGVVVYSGWNNNGYGYLLVVDHGNGWQSIYAHLDTIDKQCGAYVFQGDVIAGLGTTGNSSGPHLHFELRNATYGTVNPWDFLIR
jgi:murein DD-endopeptidase MepM/ murein hydrolase activator NlpD